MSLPLLDFRVQRKAFAGHTVLQDVHLQLAEGEVVSLLGPSGCGKSTLLRIVAGLERDYSGQALRGEGEVAFVFQEPRLMPWLTVLDNVLLVTGASPAARLRACELLAAMGLGDVLDAFPGRLSGGMQRRVALARAFVIEPKLLLMDEPFVSLDVPTANRLRAMLVELWQRSRATVLFVTHDLREALALADRICFLSPAPGRVVLELPIVLPRPRLPDDAAVQTLQAELLAQHPELLAGLATSPDGTTDE